MIQPISKYSGVSGWYIYGSARSRKLDIAAFGYVLQISLPTFIGRSIDANSGGRKP